MGFLVFSISWFPGPGILGKKVEGAGGFEEGVGAVQEQEGYWAVGG
jgi:hypothetical protein